MLLQVNFNEAIFFYHQQLNRKKKEYKEDCYKNKIEI